MFSRTLHSRTLISRALSSPFKINNTPSCLSIILQPNTIRSFSHDFRSKPLFSHSEKNFRVLSSIGAISSSSSSTSQGSPQQHYKIVVILPQDDRGDYMLIKDASGHCSLPKITISSSTSSSSVDIYQEIQNVLLQRLGYGYARAKTEADAKNQEFDSRALIRPLLDFDFTHGNLTVSNYVYHAQLLEKVQPVSDENTKGKVVQYMAMIELEKEV
ncbi:hypothetical protein C9374_007450 [Naegleria lovaniensis]|uniref:Uncharacterized protein n=1 Tax=Naegleria lovaniensis TaxID=51637 RepID=A0AA88GMV1_NAELO|nr:uncharacterized protein C9374_007450 [Naegleria lovaniensis]KAG2379311.1 hypothetical protein C9374_007450 [Naegleria lovaniensis]